MHVNFVVIVFILAFFVVPQVLRAMRGSSAKAVVVRRGAGADPSVIDDDDGEDDERSDLIALERGARGGTVTVTTTASIAQMMSGVLPKGAAEAIASIAEAAAGPAAAQAIAEAQRTGRPIDTDALRRAFEDAARARTSATQTSVSRRAPRPSPSGDPVGTVFGARAPLAARAPLTPMRPRPPLSAAALRDVVAPHRALAGAARPHG